MGISLLPNFKGTYQLVPPPGFKVGGWGLKKLKRGIKKAGRGVKKVGKKGVKVAKKGVKVNVKALKTVAKLSKWALKAAAKLAARPIIKIVNQLASRRGKYLAYQRSGNTAMTLADKKAGGQYALNKLRKAGPMGSFAIKVLKYTGGVTSGEGGDVLGASCQGNLNWKKDAKIAETTCGVAPAAIAAAAMNIVMITKKIMATLNTPGEAPANPAAAAREEQPTEEVQPVVESAEDSTEEPAEETEETPEEGATEGATLEEQIEHAAKTKNRALLKKLASKLLRQRRASF